MGADRVVLTPDELPAVVDELLASGAGGPLFGCGAILIWSGQLAQLARAHGLHP